METGVTALLRFCTQVCSPVAREAFRKCYRLFLRVTNDHGNAPYRSVGVARSRQERWVHKPRRIGAFIAAVSASDPTIGICSQMDHKKPAHENGACTGATLLHIDHPLPKVARRARENTPIVHGLLDLARQSALALKTLALELTVAADRLAAFTSPLFRWFFVEASAFHFAKDAFALHPFFQYLQCLLDVIIANDDLQGALLLPRRLSFPPLQCRAA